jgi:peptidoglycan/LPS O-acetylase OafA/YrhL
LRLAPAYYLAILLVVFTWPVHPSPVDVLKHASFLHGLFWRGNLSFDGIWWSLTPEVVFYATLPLLVLRLRSLKTRLALFGILAFISFITRLHIGEIGDPMPNGYPQSAAFWYWYELPTTHLYLFMAGVLLKMAAERLNARKEIWLIQPVSATVEASVSAGVR